MVKIENVKVGDKLWFLPWFVEGLQNEDKRFSPPICWEVKELNGFGMIMFSDDDKMVSYSIFQEHLFLTEKEAHEKRVSNMEAWKTEVVGREVLGFENRLIEAKAMLAALSKPVDWDLEVWHVPDVPGKGFRVPVESEEEGSKVMAILAAYDEYLLERNLTEDSSNAQGMTVLVNGEREDLEANVDDWEKHDQMNQDTFNQTWDAIKEATGMIS